MSVGFTKNTTGYGTGRMIEKDTFCDISVGALAHRGTAHFYDEEIAEMFRQIGFRDVTCDKAAYTRFNQKEYIENIIISAFK